MRAPGLAIGQPEDKLRDEAISIIPIEAKDRTVTLVATLIAGPGGEETLRQVTAQLAAKLSLTGSPDWLAPGLACDLMLADHDMSAIETVAREAIGEAAIDMLVQPQTGRRKRVLVADLEATIIKNEMLEELAEFVGLRAHVAEITRRAMNGELDFTAALTKRVALLRGLPVTVLDEAAKRIRMTPGARALLATCRADGIKTALVSGGFTVFADRVAAEFGFDRVFANRLDIKGGRIAGTVQSPIVDREGKRKALLVLAKEFGVGLEQTLAVGDGANDLPMLDAAGLGIAFHAKPAVAAAARWRIDHADLTALLYVQGYRAEEIVRRH